jgi:phosphoglucosamine mutase
MSRLFGTDGVRGLANVDITAELALNLATAAAHVLGREARAGGRKPKAVVGRDPRASGEFLSAAVIAGLASAGVDVHNVGVLPTPAVAFLTSDMDAHFGVMLSASHNAMPDNGIKFFAAGGHKLPDAVEDEIAAQIGVEWKRPVGAEVGRVHENRAGQARYVAHLLAAVPNRLDGLTVVLDCAHGAASEVSPEVFRLAGADVFEIGASPDGLNINDGYGSTHLDRLQAAVRDKGAHLGIAHDGDADRCLAVDADGNVIDGDQIMGILAVALKSRGRLAQDTLVATVMSNLGLLKAMEREGITVRQTGVGDRYVLEDMRAGEYSLGGAVGRHHVPWHHRRRGATGSCSVPASPRPSSLPSSANHDPDASGAINVKGVDKSASRPTSCSRGGRGHRGWRQWACPAQVWDGARPCASWSGCDREAPRPWLSASFGRQAPPSLIEFAQVRR